MSTISTPVYKTSLEVFMDTHSGPDRGRGREGGREREREKEREKETEIEIVSVRERERQRHRGENIQRVHKLGTKVKQKTFSPDLKDHILGLSGQAIRS